MTTIPNTAPNAADGKVSNPKAKGILHKLNNMDMTTKILAIAVLGLIAVAAFVIIGPPRVETIKTTSNTIQLSNTFWNPDGAQEALQNWVPTALNVEEGTIKEILISGTRDGRSGTVILNNGDIIPFTLHNYDGTFTVTRN